MPFQDPNGLPITITGNSPDVSGRPETSRITKVEFSPQSVYIRHTREADWPQPIPPGWEGGVQYTSWYVIWVDGAWWTAGCLEHWKTAPDDPFSGSWKGGEGGAPFSHGKSDFWYHAVPMNQKQPHSGELIGIFVTAGSQRMKDVTDPNCIERSNLVFVNVPSADTGVYTFDGGSEGEGGGTVPPGLPGYDEQHSIEFGTACNETYKESGAAMDPGMISVHSQRCAFDYYQGHMSWQSSFEKHVDEFRAVYSLPPKY